MKPAAPLPSAAVLPALALLTLLSGCIVSGVQAPPPAFPAPVPGVISA